MSRLRTGARALGAALVASALTLTLGASPAHAAIVVSDGFEADTQARWSLGAEGPTLDPSGEAGYAEITDRPGWVQGGTQALRLATWAERSGFTWGSRRVRLPSERTGCRAYISIKAVSFPASGKIKLNFEVIDPSTWEYLALKPVTIERPSGDPTFGRYTSPWWEGGPRTVVVRLSLLGSGEHNKFGTYVHEAVADDVTVSCGA